MLSNFRVGMNPENRGIRFLLNFPFLVYTVSYPSQKAKTCVEYMPGENETIFDKTEYIT
jgi:hypothetical protein